MVEDLEIVTGIYFLIVEDPEIIPGIYSFMALVVYSKASAGSN